MERGRLEKVPLATVRRIVAALDASLVIEVRWRAGALERLLDEDHAVLVAWVGELLRAAGWLVEIEATYSEFGERGSYDILAFHPATATLLVIEVKTDLASTEGTLRKLDEKVRLSPKVARERYGWSAALVSRLLVLPESSTLRRRIARHTTLFERVFPDRGRDVRRWVQAPNGRLAALWFLSPSGATTVIRGRGGSERVRRQDLPLRSGQAAA